MLFNLRRQHYPVNFGDLASEILRFPVRSLDQFWQWINCRLRTCHAVGWCCGLSLVYSPWFTGFETATAVDMRYHLILLEIPEFKHIRCITFLLGKGRRWEPETEECPLNLRDLQKRTGARLRNAIVQHENGFYKTVVSQQRRFHCRFTKAAVLRF